MADVIENPVLNSPFSEPERHFVFSEIGITNEIAEARRISAYFTPIPPPKKLGGQMALQVCVQKVRRTQSGDCLGMAL